MKMLISKFLLMTLAMRSVFTFASASTTTLFGGLFKSSTQMKVISLNAELP